MNYGRGEEGNQTLEFTMVGIPLTFILFSIANMSFAMLTMHTLQESVEQGARYVATRGSTCSSGGNTCSVTVQQIAAVVVGAAPGISPSNIKLTLTPAADTGNAITCNPLTLCMSSCSTGCNASRTVTWPTSTNSDNSPGQDIVVSADCTVSAPMVLFWPGNSASKQIPSATFHAYSRQRLTF